MKNTELSFDLKGTVQIEVYFKIVNVTFLNKLKTINHEPVF